MTVENEEKIAWQETNENQGNSVGDFVEETNGEQGSVRVCPKCQTEVAPGQMFCGNCGAQMDKIAQPSRGKRMIIAVACAVLVAAVGISAIGVGGVNFDFNEEYADIADELWCYISADGSCMEIDTNPNNRKKYTNQFAISAIEEVNKDLGFPESLMRKMTNTRALDGTQQDGNDRFNVSWTYHPNQGLEVVYEKKN